MKVILIDDVDGLGQQGDVVTVKNGYGRNFLIPRGLALVATDSVIRHQQELRRQAAHKLLKKKEDAEALQKIIEKEEVVLHARVGEENRIFGSITAQQVALKLAERGLEVDRRKIDLDEIRTVGVFTGTVKLHPEVAAKVKIRVEPEDGGATVEPAEPAEG
ncbi:MAG: 50S ribosomal protein L9 [Rhodothermales bacterium]|nr:50S ribosomal protein L9 [Rhodothermales bacterium]